jgi:hypothetical protein
MFGSCARRRHIENSLANGNEPFSSQGIDGVFAKNNSRTDGICKGLNRKSREVSPTQTLCPYGGTAFPISTELEIGIAQPQKYGPMIKTLYIVPKELAVFLELLQSAKAQKRNGTASVIPRRKLKSTSYGCTSSWLVTVPHPGLSVLDSPHYGTISWVKTQFTPPSRTAQRLKGSGRPSVPGSSATCPETHAVERIGHLSCRQYIIHLPPLKSLNLCAPNPSL